MDEHRSRHFLQFPDTTFRFAIGVVSSNGCKGEVLTFRLACFDPSMSFENAVVSVVSVNDHSMRLGIPLERRLAL
jgi:hypothetical protein